MRQAILDHLIAQHHISLAHADAHDQTAAERVVELAQRRHELKQAETALKAEKKRVADVKARGGRPGRKKLDDLTETVLGLRSNIDHLDGDEGGIQRAKDGAESHRAFAAELAAELADHGHDVHPALAD